MFNQHTTTQAHLEIAYKALELVKTPPLSYASSVIHPYGDKDRIFWEFTEFTSEGERAVPLIKYLTHTYAGRDVIRLRLDHSAIMPVPEQVRATEEGREFVYRLNAYLFLFNGFTLTLGGTFKHAGNKYIKVYRPNVTLAGSRGTLNFNQVDFLMAERLFEIAQEN